MNPLKVEYINDNNYDIEIEVTLPDISNDIYINYIAAAPADTMTNFSGSGLPYTSKEQAYYDTPNKGTIKVMNKKGIIRLQKPNSYYKDFNKLQTPHVMLFIDDKQIADISIETELINNRSIRYPINQFENNKKKLIVSQESILRSKDYNAHFY